MEDTAQKGVMSRNTKPFRGRHRLDLGFLPHSMDQAPLTKNLPPARFALGCQKDVDHRTGDPLGCRRQVDCDIEPSVLRCEQDWEQVGKAFTQPGELNWRPGIAWQREKQTCHHQ